MWKQLARKMQVIPPRGTPFRKPTKDELLQFSQQHGFTFPASYLEFIQTFGAGTLCNRYFVVAAPDFGLEDEFEARGCQSLAECYNNGEFVHRMIPFGSSGYGDIFAWDPTEVTRNRPLEYRIYILPRHDNTITALCDSFRDFIHEVCFGQAINLAFCGKTDPDWVVEYTFHPTRPQRRKAQYKAHAGDA